jgi:hypothetical protein
MATPVALYKVAVSEVFEAGVPVTPIFGPVAGGIITNPATIADQGIDPVEVLYLDVTGLASDYETVTTIAVQPGQSYVVTPGQATDVSVNAKTAGHRFSGIVYQPPTPYPPAPQLGTFPPAGPTTLTAVIPSYLYQEYADDDDLQSFVAAYNGLAQGYVDWFASIGLPVYTGQSISGALLDWVAQGVYGMIRPALSSGRNRDLGPLNTYAYNTLPLNRRKLIGPTNVTATSDDVFKRIITWNFYKGDGNVFNVRWLKRRVMRFLTGANGSAPNVDQTYIISVTFGAGSVVSIRISVGTRSITGGALYNRFGFNRMAYNSLTTAFHPAADPPPFAAIFKEAVDSGALILPFQYKFSVAI